ncbi:Glycerophosphoryl diester phosphodiesterase family-domain-containing protein [Amylocarpus encephaloides]|uniref:Glycerophosphoryl diester phosphodiesterase family-domain-containing protein n=1 Tax=Amylocarpus encephaloides TaxID=45428 RepID=A0A9P7YEG0_9HELO|nr:Glycerophosphoryl diester phosphodiesterase family-domain-containing protein [Amylocarpus encephaloides]
MLRKLGRLPSSGPLLQLSLQDYHFAKTNTLSERLVRLDKSISYIKNFNPQYKDPVIVTQNSARHKPSPDKLNKYAHHSISTKRPIKTDLVEDKEPPSENFALHFAASSGDLEALDLLLLSPTLDINCQNTNGESALYISARAGNFFVVSQLIDGSGLRQIHLNSAEHSYGYTPLIIASIGNHLEVVKHLVAAGADQNHQDIFDWCAKDHACFRGFWSVSEVLSETVQEVTESMPKLTTQHGNTWLRSPMQDSRVFVNLGALNTKKTCAAVDLTPYMARYPSSPYQRSGYTISISAIGASGSSGFIELPVLEDETNYPLMFSTKDPNSLKLVFKIFEGQEQNRPLGSSIALLKNLKEGLGDARESLLRDYTLPIHERGTLDFIGTVTFNFLIVTPYNHPNLRSTLLDDIWKDPTVTQVVGHRGFGQNTPTIKRLQIGENTINSFLSTISQGVNYIECDVQLTKDHVPVIYHDFLVSEAGADVACHNLSFDQFMHINETQTPPPDVVTLISDKILENGTPVEDMTPRTRSRSLDLIEKGRNRDFVARMRKTHEYRLKGFKGNTRGDHIHNPFTTLEELLKSIPENVGIYMELKYPMLFEAEDWKMDLYGIEINIFLNTILDIAFTHGRSRSIIFMSFSPEICILVSQKQAKYPVMFLSESGLFPTGDIRASSLQQAVHFSRRWGLEGICMNSEPFVKCPRLVEYVRAAGLVCTSWGALNDDPEGAKIQAKAGVQAIIVDAVRLIANTLQESGR